jgi:hypothetical protein
MCGYCPSTQRSRSWYIAHFASVMLGCARSSAWPLLSLAPRKSLKMLIAVPSPRLRTAPTIAHREYDCSRDLRPAKRGSGVSLHSSNPEPLMSALGHKQTLRRVNRTSASPPKGDIRRRYWDVRFVPKADILRCGKNVAIRSPIRANKQ